MPPLPLHGSGPAVKLVHASWTCEAASPASAARHVGKDLRHGGAVGLNAALLRARSLLCAAQRVAFGGRQLARPLAFDKRWVMQTRRCAGVATWPQALRRDHSVTALKRLEDDGSDLLHSGPRFLPTPRPGRAALRRQCPAPSQGCERRPRTGQCR